MMIVCLMMRMVDVIPVQTTHIPRRLFVAEAVMMIREEPAVTVIAANAAGIGKTGVFIL